jgi:hypothetical protein
MLYILFICCVAAVHDIERHRPAKVKGIQSSRRQLNDTQNAVKTPTFLHILEHGLPSLCQPLAAASG